MSHTTFLREVQRLVKEMKHPLLLLVVILCEILFKASQHAGIIAYAIVLVVGLVAYLFWQDRFLAIMLAIPLVRVVGSAVSLEFSLKLLVLSVMLLVYVVVLHLHSPLHFFHQQLKPVGLVLALGIGCVFGVVMQQVIGFSRDPLLLIALLCAALAEEVFRAAVLEERAVGMVLLSSLLFGLLVFSSLVVLGIAVAFGIAVGFLYVRQKHILLPIVAHMMVAVILVLPKFF